MKKHTGMAVYVKEIFQELGELTNGNILKYTPTCAIWLVRLLNLKMIYL